MLTVKGAASTRPTSAPTRLLLAQSSATRTRSPRSGGRSRRSPRSARSRKRYSPGRGDDPPRNITESFPSCASASCMARSEPSASPSGASCEVTRKRWLSASAAVTAAMSAFVVVTLLGRELVDHLRQAHPALDRLIVFEGQHGRSAQAELAGDAALQDAVRGLQACERPLAFALRPEDAD